MNTTRRDFIRYCGMSAATLGLTAADLFRLGEVLPIPTAQRAVASGVRLHGLLGLVAEPRVGPGAGDGGRFADQFDQSRVPPEPDDRVRPVAVEALDAAYARGGYVLPWRAACRRRLAVRPAGP